MHSPPVQPISSSRSGTGSVITMWLEVSVSRRRMRRRAAERRRRSRAPRRRRGPARRPPRRRPRRPRAATEPTGRALVDLDPGLAQPRRPARARAAPAARSPRPGRRRRRGRSATRSARGPRRRRPAGTRRARRAPRRPRPPAPRRRSQAGRGRDLQVAGLAKPGVDPLLVAEGADLGDRALRRARDLDRRRVAEALAHRRQAEPERVDEPPVAPARALAADGRPRRARPAPPGSSRFSCQAVHSPV